MTGSDYNTVIGEGSMGSQYYMGSNNVAVGKGAGANSQASLYNTFLGTDAGVCIAGQEGFTVGGLRNGSYNIYVGALNGANILTGNYNVIIGNLVEAVGKNVDPTFTVNNNIVIADGSGSIRARYNSGWILSGGAVSASSFIATSFTGSLNGTASWASNAISSSYALNATNAANATSASYSLVATTASYALNSNLLDGLDSTVFATTGSNTFKATQTISGSVVNEVRALSVSSNTASLDLSTGNFFTLTLTNGATTHVSASNAQRGQTVQLQITQPAGVGGVSFSSAFTFPSGSSYTAFASASAVDVLSFISFNGTTLRGVAQYNFI
jgi:hypothetical protein